MQVIPINAYKIKVTMIKTKNITYNTFKHVDNNLDEVYSYKYLRIDDAGTSNQG